MDDFKKYILPLLILFIVFRSIFYYILESNILSLLNQERFLFCISFFSAIFISNILFVSIVSIKYVRNFTNEKNNINIIDLFKFCINKYNILTAKKLLILALTPYCITQSCNIVTLYKHSTEWHDHILFTIEKELIEYLVKQPHIISPYFMDEVYISLAGIVFLAFSATFVFGKTETLLHISVTAILACWVARTIGFLFPTAGPGFYKPEYFDIAGTKSEFLQNMLRLFMKGYFPELVLAPGTMAMPSLHVGFAFLVLVTLYKLNRYTLIAALPFFVLTWVSTVYLGWHYFLDGVVGVAVMTLSSIVSHYYLTCFEAISLVPQALKAKSSPASSSYKP
jgi:membrane-associated phospholipid phosphatase